MDNGHNRYDRVVITIMTVPHYTMVITVMTTSFHHGHHCYDRVVITVMTVLRYTTLITPRLSPLWPDGHNSYDRASLHHVMTVPHYTMIITVMTVPHYTTVITVTTGWS
ncbi:hypothetical protein TIFTF001_045636 [Ficus carica]|uniref:Uncharacterized protein n=1 Tax=Ficus carica TaxID=3494 RepID=A0AA87Z1N6_FICCA|nr:hypothetical protein TIFTF001_045636 [Ficus carica]